MNKTIKNTAKWGLAVAAVPLAVIILLAVSLYVPFVQDWAVHTVADYASGKTGMQISVERVRLQFPLDLGIDNFRMIKPNDSLPQVKDTVADMKSLVVSVKLLPLLGSRVEIDRFDLSDVKINTSDFVHEARVKGRVGRLSLQSHGIDWAKQTVDVDDALLKNADVSVELSDTVPPDTAKTPTYWKINVRKLAAENTTAVIHMPGDTLQITAHLGKAKAQDGIFDLYKNSYDVGSFELDGGTIAYDNNFKTRMKGIIDPNHIALTGVSLGVDSLMFESPRLKMQLRHCTFKEKNGLELAGLAGGVDMDSLRLTLSRLEARTPDSWIRADVKMDLNAFSDSCPGKLAVKASASVAKRDIMRFMQGMPAAFRRQWPDKPLTLNTVAEGNLQRLDIRMLNAALPSAMKVDATGYATDITDMKRVKANVDFKADAYNISFVNALAGKGGLGVTLPRNMYLGGNVKTAGLEKYTADLTFREGGGTLRAKGTFDMPRMTYRAKLSAANMKINHFMPSLGMKDFTGDLAVSGNGTDPMSKSMRVDASADVKKFIYDRYHLSGINVDAQLKDGLIHAAMNSDNKLIKGLLRFDGLINSRKLDATVSADVSRMDFFALGVTQKPLIASLCCHFDVATDMKKMYMLRGGTSDVTILDSARRYRPVNISVDILTDRDTTRALVDCGDFYLNMNAKGGYERLLNCGSALGNRLISDLKNRRIDYAGLRALLPAANIRMQAGENNIFSRYMNYCGYAFKGVDMDMTLSPVNGMNGGLQINELTSEGLKLDTIRFNIVSDSVNCAYNGQVRNAKDNPQYVFNTLFDGYLMERGSGLNLAVYDAADRLGIKLGATAELEDNGARLHLLTDDIVLGYKRFTANEDNYVFMGDDKRLSAKLILKGNDGMGFQLYTNDENVEALQDVTASFNDFDLSKITAVLPYFPKVTGKMNGDFHAILTEDQLTLSSTLGVKKMTYEGCGMGDVSTEFVYMPHSDGSHYIDAVLYSDVNKVGTLVGNYNPSGKGVIDATMTLDELPLSLVNGFIPQQLFGFEGNAEGKMTVKGDIEKPIVNGEVYLDSTYMVSVPYGVRLRFSNDPVRVADSKLMFENFEVFAHNDHPLNIYGDIDFSDPADMSMDVRMRAENYQLINARENYRSVAYGKAFIDFFGFVRGKLDNLQMRGKLNVLGSTDVAYILRDSPITTDNQMDELVKFTNFKDTTAQSVARPSLTGLDMDLTVSVNQGAHVMAYLNADHSNYVDLTGGGDLRMTYDPLNDLRLTGKYTLNNGEMKYALPVIPLKTFTIENGSYIEFTGDMMNPKLNITATEETKAAVGSSGQAARSVLFKCGVVITRTLNDMGLEFTLDAPEDMSLHNELQTMSLEQRGKLAVTMLTTGMYLADGNTSGFSMNSALSSFLQSEINSITGNALRTLDLSFGIGNSTDATGNSHTDYSFKFSKRFWNNRLKIIIGGKVSSGAANPNQNQSFFDNVTFEYRLGETSNKYLNLFYDNNSYDWLEGNTREFGVGFAWRRTLQHFKDLFNFGKENKQDVPPQQPKPAAAEAAGSDAKNGAAVVNKEIK